MFMAEENTPQVMKDLQGYFKSGERTAIYNNAESFRDKVLIRLLWVTGRRLSEVLNIKVYEINFESKQIEIHILKKKKSKTSLSYIDDFTNNLLKSFIANYGLKREDYLFKSEFNITQPISRQRAFQIIRASCFKAGITHVGNKEPHPHHFRHTFAVEMAKKLKTPADVRKLQLLLDHSTLAVTEQYLKFSDYEVKELIENIGS